MSYDPVPNIDPDPRELYVYLEAFLVHYRNLIRFFNGENARRQDLSTKKPEVWAGRPLSGEELRLLRDPAGKLEKYHDDISKFLQHCTKSRSEGDVTWDVEQMMMELQPILNEFEKAFPRQR